jgi:hypothetical protein
MARTTIDIAASPDTARAVLSDADLYGESVVGTKEIVRADPEWPQPGAELEYRLGAGPITIGDRTVVVESEPSRLLVLRAELRHLGAATIRLDEPAGAGTRVLMDEDPVEEAIGLAHNPLSDAALKRRNDLALDRLRRLAEARA